ncbi:DUF5988 family protein [Micromonospora sp. NPDC047074]|uniref:DUF5988 family protein n=1 Tax=Micromonospora sp. NPDC047074 TaxID=3154339 RepID=UPI0033EF61DE
MKDISESATTVRTAGGAVVDTDDRPGRPALAEPVSRDATGIIDVVLEGGPADFPADLRSHQVDQVAEKIKVRHYGGYEHFERDSSLDLRDVPVVFRWTGRTRIAE